MEYNVLVDVTAWWQSHCLQNMLLYQHAIYFSQYNKNAPNATSQLISSLAISEALGADTV